MFAHLIYRGKGTLSRCLLSLNFNPDARVSPARRKPSEMDSRADTNL